MLPIGSSLVPEVPGVFGIHLSNIGLPVLEGRLVCWYMEKCLNSDDPEVVLEERLSPDEPEVVLEERLSLHKPEVVMEERLSSDEPGAVVWSSSDVIIS